MFARPFASQDATEARGRASRAPTRRCVASLLLLASSTASSQPLLLNLVGIDTRGSDTASFALASDPVRAPVTALRLGFDLPVLASLADFRLVRAAAGTTPQSTDCTLPPVADDVALEGLQLRLDADPRRVDLLVPSPRGLPAGRYRLIACDTLAGALGAPFDGDGDGVPGGVAIRDFSIESTPVLQNPGFDVDLAGWSADDPSTGSILTTWSPFDADGDAASGSMRITGSGGAGVRLANSTCALVGAIVSGSAVPATLHLRYRVLSGDVRIFLTAVTGFAGDMGEPGCIGPSVAREIMIEAGTPRADFLTHRSDRIWLPHMPHAEFQMRIVGRTGDFDLLIDDVGFGLDPEPVFAAGFERGDPR